MCVCGGGGGGVGGESALSVLSELFKRRLLQSVVRCSSAIV